MGSGYAIPVGHPGDLIDDQAFALSSPLQMQIVRMGGSIYLLANSSTDPLLLADLTEPAGAQGLAADPGFVGAEYVVDANGILWIGGSGQTTVNGYSIHPDHAPSSPFVLEYANVNWNPGGAAVSSPTPHVSTAGRLLVAHNPQLMGYLALSASGAPT
jgi:hypothetical protein